MKYLSLLLYIKYLRARKLMLLSIAAVAMSSALLIVVASLFTGFINAIESTAVDTVGDVVIDMAGTVKGVVGLFIPRFKHKELQLRVSCLDKPIEIYADEDKIIQVINNLLGNAVKFVEKGFVEIALIDKGDSLECSVHDTGKGIDAEDLTKVFGKFQQFGRIPGPGEKGTGLGLAISKGIITMHKGDIWVESKPGEGTTFIFTLPKFSAEDLFKEYVNDELKNAIDQDSELSIISFSVKDFTRADETIVQALKLLEASAEGKLCRKDDFVLRTPSSVLIALSGTRRQDAEKVKTRLQNLVSEYISNTTQKEALKIISSLSSFPEDGSNFEQLFATLNLS